MVSWLIILVDEGEYNEGKIVATADTFEQAIETSEAYETASGLSFLVVGPANLSSTPQPSSETKQKINDNMKRMGEIAVATMELEHWVIGGGLLH